MNGRSQRCSHQLLYEIYFQIHFQYAYKLFEVFYSSDIMKPVREYNE